MGAVEAIEHASIGIVAKSTSSAHMSQSLIILRLLDQEVTKRPKQHPDLFPEASYSCLISLSNAIPDLDLIVPCDRRMVGEKNLVIFVG